MSRLCTPDVPLKSTSNRKKPSQEKLLRTFDLDPACLAQFQNVISSSAGDNENAIQIITLHKSNKPSTTHSWDFSLTRILQTDAWANRKRQNKIPLFRLRTRRYSVKTSPEILTRNQTAVCFTTIISTNCNFAPASFNSSGRTNYSFTSLFLWASRRSFCVGQTFLQGKKKKAFRWAEFAAIDSLRWESILRDKLRASQLHDFAWMNGALWGIYIFNQYRKNLCCSAL